MKPYALIAMLALGLALAVPAAASKTPGAYTITDIGSLSAREDSYNHAEAINDRGEIVGVSSVDDPQGESAQHAFIWRNGKITDLGTLPGGTLATPSASTSGARWWAFRTKRTASHMPFSGMRAR